MCKGKGYFDTWGKPCEEGNMHKKSACPCCEGACYIPGAASYTKCPKCKGKGGFDTWDKPCLKVDMHHKTVCVVCNGKAYLPGVIAPPQQFAPAPAPVPVIAPPQQFPVPQQPAVPADPTFHPNVDGFEAVKKGREFDHHVYIITVSHMGTTYRIKRRFKCIASFYEDLRKTEGTGPGDRSAIPDCPKKMPKIPFMPAFAKKLAKSLDHSSNEFAQQRSKEIQTFLTQIQKKVTDAKYEPVIRKFYQK